MKQNFARENWETQYGESSREHHRVTTMEDGKVQTPAPVRILLIEDNPDDQIFVRLCLEDSNTPFDLQCVDNYEDGLQALQTGQWDAALVDYYLGGETGAELIRQAHAAGYSTPCIMLTGTENEEIDQEAAQSGAADYLPKDWLTPRDLGRALQYALVSTRSQQLLYKAKQFVQSTVDALPLSIAVLDEQTKIIAVNQTRKQRALDSDFRSPDYGIGANYLQLCKSAQEQGDEYAARISAGISAVRAGEQEIFSIGYPCHGPNAKRWFILRVTRFVEESSVYLVVSHDDISATRMATEALRDNNVFSASIH
jgi:CheY-like chemotaxis protein